MISRILIIFLITATVNCLNYDRVPRLIKNKTADYRVSLSQILKLPEANRPPFNLFKSREEFVKLAEQNIKNYKPYNYKVYRPYNPSKLSYIYDRDYVTKVLSSLGLLRPFQNLPSNPQNTSESVITIGTENLNFKVNSSTESPKPVNNSFVTSESNGRETISTGNTNEDINTTTNSYTKQTTDAEVSIFEDTEKTTELPTESFEFSSYTAEGTNISNYFTTESVTESNRINQTTIDGNSEETIFTTTERYTTLTPNTEDSSTVDEGTIVQSSTDSFGIGNTTYILSYSSTEPASAEAQYTTEILTTERLETENENLLLTSSHHVETTTSSNTQDGFNPTTPDVAAFLTQFGHVPTSISEDVERTTELTTERFEFSTYIAEGTNIPYFATTVSVTASNRINQTTTDGNSEETIFTTTERYTTLTPNTEDSSTVDEGTIVQSSTDSLGIGNTTDILIYSSTEPASAEAQYTTEILTTERLEMENENLLLTSSHPVESTTTSNAQDDFNSTTPDVAAFITQFAHVPTSIAEDVEKTTELTTERFEFSTYTAEVTNIPYFTTTVSVTESNRINQTTFDSNSEETIFATTERYTPQTSNTEDTSTTSSTQDGFNPTTPDVATFTIQFGHVPTSIAEDSKRTTELTTEKFGFPTNSAQDTNFPNYSTTESIAESNQIYSTTDANTEESIYTTTDSYTILAPNAEDSSTADEKTITQFSTDPATNAKTQYATEISTTDFIEPETENFLLTGSNRVETTTTSNTEEAVDSTSIDATAPMNNFENYEDVESTTALTESFEFPTNADDVTDISNNFTSKSVTASNRNNETTKDAYEEETIFTTTDSYTTLTPNAEASLTVDQKTIAQSSTESVGIAITTDILRYSSTEASTNAETEIFTTDCIEPENENLMFTNSNRVETTKTTEENVSPTTDSYTEQPTDAAVFITTAENFPTLNGLDVEKTIDLTTPSVWTTTNAVDGTDILDYFTKEPVTSPETTTLTLETDIAHFMFIGLNRIEAATATNVEQSTPTTMVSSTEQTVDSSTTLVPNLIEKPITELTMESWDVGMTTKTDILQYSTTGSVIFTSTMNPNDTTPSTIDSLTTETNRMETISTINGNNDIHTTPSNYEDQTSPKPVKPAHEVKNYTTSEVIDVESTTLEFDIEPSSQICEESTETENFPETVAQSETVTAEQIETVTSTTEATEISIDETTEFNEKTTVNILNGNTTEYEPVVLSTTDNFNVKDSIGITTEISKEIESLEDLLQSTTENSNEISTQASDSTSTKDITESTTNVMLKLWNKNATQLLEDITTEMYEVSSTSAPMQNSFTSNALIFTMSELSTLSTKEGSDDIATEISQIECTTEIIEQVKETTVETEATGEMFEKSTIVLMPREISDIETPTEQILKNIMENDKGNVTSRVLLTDDTTAIQAVDNIHETNNEILPEAFEQSTNQFMITPFQESTTEVMDVNTTEFYKENTAKQIDSITPISSVENPTITSPIITTEHLIHIKSNTVDITLNEETSVTPSNLLENRENSSIEPLYTRQQKLARKNLNKDSSKRKPKKFNYDTDVMPSLGDYDYI